jgi:protein tyrosine/serine phosphatase
VVAALRSIAHARGAALVHCAAGKDRTGVVVALALSVAGVRPDAIVADYAATGDRTEPLLARLRRSPTYSADVNRRPADAHRPRAETMTAFLAELDARHGGAAAWLTAHGLSQDDLELLRAKLRSA